MTTKHDGPQGQGYVLGETDREIKLSSLDEFCDGVLAIADQAKRQVQIFSPDLEAPLYDNEPFVRSLARVANSHRTSLVQILIHDPKPAVKDGHRIVALCQQFSTYVHVRRIAEDYVDNREAFLLADQAGIVHRISSDRYQGTLNFNDVTRVGRMMRFFSEVWERSGPVPEFRRLFI